MRSLDLILSLIDIKKFKHFEKRTFSLIFLLLQIYAKRFTFLPPLFHVALRVRLSVGNKLQH